MKKYLMGLGALALAFTLNSFTPEKNTSRQAPLYWYHWNGTVLGSAISEDPITRDEAEDATGCQKLTNQNCARAYSSPQTPGTVPSAATQDFLSSMP